jgi:hypothetical protein
MLLVANTVKRIFPATVFYNEGWLLRLVLDWFHRNRSEGHPLNFAPGALWYSEGLLPSPFLARTRGDKLAEGYTHADGVVGHLRIGDRALANVALAEKASQFLVIEAKLFSRLSPGVTNAKYFDQAARNVACIAQVISERGADPSQLSSLGFFLLAPESQIDDKIFDGLMTSSSIKNKVTKRISEYSNPDREPKEEWFERWFLPTLSGIKIKTMSWENVIRSIDVNDPAFAADLNRYYEHCLEYNRLKEPEQA